MSGQKRSCDPSGSVALGAPPEKKKGGEDGEGMSTGSGGTTAVETVIKLGGGSNLVRLLLSLMIVDYMLYRECEVLCCMSQWRAILGGSYSADIILFILLLLFCMIYLEIESDRTRGFS